MHHSCLNSCKSAYLKGAKKGGPKGSHRNRNRRQQQTQTKACDAQEHKGIATISERALALR